MFGRLVNGIFERAPYGISGEEAERLKYKPVVLTPAPETDDEHMPEEWLQDTDAEIIRHWNVVEIAPEPEPEPDASEILDILTGGAS